MMKALVGLLTALGGFFALLNTFGGIVSGIWLAILGEWWAIGWGFILIIISSMILGIVLLPSLALSAAIYAARRSRIGILFFGLLSNLYIAGVITAWCVAMLFLFMSRAGEQSWIPLLIWSYGAAIGPWAWMASKEAQGGSGESSTLAVMFAQVAYLVMVVVGIFAGGSIIALAQVFGVVMLLYVAFQMLVAFYSLDDMQRELA